MYEDFQVLLEKYLYEGEKEKFRHTLYQLHESYIVIFFSKLTRDEREIFYGLIEANEFALFFSKISIKKQREVLKELSIEQSIAIMNEMRSDELVMCLKRLDGERREEYLAFMSRQQARKIRRLLSYDKRQAASMMALEYLTVKPTDLIRDTLVKIGNQGKKIENISSIYVVNDLNELIGVVSLRDILTAQADDYINSIMKEQVISVRPHFAKRDIIKVVKQFDLMTIPVVSKNNELLGVITIDDVLKTNEPLSKQTFYQAQSSLETFFNKKKKIYMSVGISLLFLVALAYTEITMKQVTLVVMTSIVLAVMTGVISTRYLLKMVDTSEDLSKEVLRKKIKKELFSGFVLSIIVSVLSAFLVFGFIKMDTHLSVVISIAMFFAILSSTISGVFVPLIIKWKREVKHSAIITTNALVVSLVTLSISLVLYQTI